MIDKTTSVVGLNINSQATKIILSYCFKTNMQPHTNMA